MKTKHFIFLLLAALSLSSCGVYFEPGGHYGGGHYGGSHYGGRHYSGGHYGGGHYRR